MRNGDILWTECRIGEGAQCMEVCHLYEMQSRLLQIAIPHPSSKPPDGDFEATFPSGEGMAAAPPGICKHFGKCLQM